MKSMNQSFCQKNSTEKYPKSTSTRNFEAIKSILFQQSLHIQNSLFFFFYFSMFTFFIITENPRNFFFRKYSYYNYISNATHSLRIHRAVLEKLRFDKRLKIF